MCTLNDLLETIGYLNSLPVPFAIIHIPILNLNDKFGKNTFWPIFLNENYTETIVIIIRTYCTIKNNISNHTKVLEVNAQNLRRSFAKQLYTVPKKKRFLSDVAF